jgi:ribosomal-protein-alanine N-acetyltransferase
VDDVEVGYSLDPPYWGRGLATEIAAACVERARADLRLTTVVALTQPANARSQRVLEKIGMSRERELLHAGAPHPLYRIRFA